MLNTHFVLSRITKALLVVVPFWLSLCVAVGVIAIDSDAFQLLFLTTFVLTILRPALGLVAFAVAMPILGGGQPGFNHTVHFLIILAGLCFATCLNLIVRRSSSQFLAAVNMSNPLVFALLIYWLVAALSLVNVPTHGALRALLAPSPDLALELVKRYEGNAEYPWLSLINLSFYLWFFVFLYYEFKRSVRVQQLVLQALALGSMLTIVFGIMDYFDFVSLDHIRPIEGNSFKYERLVSFFGNTTWYAQYLVLSAPAVLSVMFFHWSGRITLSVMLCWMVVTEFCILLVNQRGGWLAYPLTLVVIWFCIYVLGLDRNQLGSTSWLQSLKKSWLKIVISLPLTLVVSFTIIYTVAGMNEAGRQHVLGFVERAQTIKNVNDRLAYLEPVLKLTRQYPIWGAGTDSFRIEYEKAFMNEDHPCLHDDPYTTEGRGTAHNLYFQTLVGKGVVGLLSLLGVMIATIWLGIKGVLAQGGGTSREQKITLMIGVAFTLALMIYSNVGEIFYVPVNGMVFAMILAASAAAGDGVAALRPRFKVSVLAILALAFIAHWLWRYFDFLGC